MPGYHLTGFYKLNGLTGSSGKVVLREPILIVSADSSLPIIEASSGINESPFVSTLPDTSGTPVFNDSTRVSVDTTNNLVGKQVSQGLKILAVTSGVAGLSSMAVGDYIGFTQNVSENTAEGLRNGLLFVGLNVLGILLILFAVVLLGGSFLVKLIFKGKKKS